MCKKVRKGTESQRQSPGSFTKMEMILGKERAKECQKEIESRVHPEDTIAFRERLLREIISRYVKKKNLRIDEVELMTGDVGSKSHCQALRGKLTEQIVKSIKPEKEEKNGQ